jgi:thiamine transport system ATP-binding protein
VSGLEIIDGRVDYDGRTLLRGVCLRVPPGRILALLGPSGSGKSSLLRCIAGVQDLDAGQIRWDGVDITSMPAHRRGFGLVFQDALLFPHLDVAGNIAFGLRQPGSRHRGRSRSAITERVTMLLELVGLPGFGTRDITTLSGGEAQRVALARALAPSPRLLLLDEPFAALDRDLRERLADEVRDLLRSLGTPAIHITHDRDEAARIADDIIETTAWAVPECGE